MNSTIKASIIGAVLGGAVIGAHASTTYWLFVSGIACAIAALVTVLAIPKAPNIYAFVAVVVAAPFLFVAFGYDAGWVYLVGLAIVYGILSVQLFQATEVAIDNFRFIAEKIRGQ